MQSDNNQKYIVVATLAFIVGFGLSWLITSNKLKEASVTEKTDVISEVVRNTEGEVEETSTTPKSDKITVKDQASGTSVVLENVVFKNVGWVVIHEDDAGKPSRILGAQLFEAGKWNGAVELLRGTLSGNIYYAMLHSDNGDRAFDPKKDLPITDENGLIVVTSFKTNIDSSDSERI